MNQNRKELKGIGIFLGYLVTAVVAFALGAKSDLITFGGASLIGLKSTTHKIDLSSIYETYSQLESKYDGTLDTQALIYGANKGLVAAAGDRHTIFLDPEDSKELDRDMSGSIGGGIGASLAMKHDKLTIVKPLKDSPAMKNGLLAGDVVLEVNSESVAKMTIDQAVAKIRGEIGTKVNIKIARDDKNLDFTITRAEIKSPTVESEIKDGVGILTIHMFNGETGKLARNAAEKFKQENVKKVILDLRNNPGGEVTAALEVSGLWLDHQLVLRQKHGDEVIETNKSIGKPILDNTKTIILVNGGSASASEIVAGALRDYKKATLVGEKTYGKGSVQTILRLSKGSKLKVTTARWYTPHDNNIDKVGIMPDKEVKNTLEDYNNDIDPQMDEAMKQ